MIKIESLINSVHSILRSLVFICCRPGSNFRILQTPFCQLKRIARPPELLIKPPKHVVLIPQSGLSIGPVERRVVFLNKVERPENAGKALALEDQLRQLGAESNEFLTRRRELPEHVQAAFQKQPIISHTSQPRASGPSFLKSSREFQRQSGVVCCIEKMRLSKELLECLTASLVNLGRISSEAHSLFMAILGCARRRHACPHLLKFIGRVTSLQDWNDLQEVGYLFKCGIRGLQFRA